MGRYVWGYKINCIPADQTKNSTDGDYETCFRQQNLFRTTLKLTYNEIQDVHSDTMWAVCEYGGSYLIMYFRVKLDS